MWNEGFDQIDFGDRKIWYGIIQKDGVDANYYEGRDTDLIHVRNGLDGVQWLYNIDNEILYIWETLSIRELDDLKLWLSQRDYNVKDIELTDSQV